MMNKRKFIKMQNQIIKKYGLNISIATDDILEYLELIKSWGNYNKSLNEKEKSEIEISELHCINWGLLHLSIDTVRPKEVEITYDYLHMINTCLRTLTATIANSILAIISLTCRGLDFPAGVIFRSLYEICFTLLAIMIDKEKCEVYFKSANEDNEYAIWNRYFRMSKLNDTLIAFERSLNSNGDLDFLEKWRKKNYRFYSEYTHNSMFRCYANTFGHPSTADGDEIMPSNLWRENITRTVYTLGQLNDLMFYVNAVFFKILSKGIILKDQLVGKEHMEMWNNAGIINLITKELFMQVKNN